MTAVRTIPIHHTGRLHRLFGQALESDFDYFSADYRDGVARANSQAKMRLAAIHPRRLLLGVYNDNELVGYSMSGREGKVSAFLFWLYIMPSMRGQQLGGQLLAATERRWAKAQVDSLSLVTHNQQDFYAHHGYVRADDPVLYIADSQMFVMTKALV